MLKWFCWGHYFLLLLVPLPTKTSVPYVKVSQLWTDQFKYWYIWFPQMKPTKRLLYCVQIEPVLPSYVVNYTECLEMAVFLLKLSIVGINLRHTWKLTSHDFDQSTKTGNNHLHGVRFVTGSVKILLKDWSCGHPGRSQFTILVPVWESPLAQFPSVTHFHITCQ